MKLSMFGELGYEKEINKICSTSYCISNIFDVATCALRKKFVGDESLQLHE